jgi:hypothetical protein
MAAAIRYPWDAEPPPAPAPAAVAELPVVSPGPKPRGRRPAARQTGVAAPADSPGEPGQGSGDVSRWNARGLWLLHHFTVSGPAEPVGEFSLAARGAGVIPWRLDLDRIEEDVFLRAIAQPPETRRLTVAGCRILARQFRERVDMRQAKANALVGQSRACPFDLHQLLPVPAAILALGPSDPAALAWLSAHWGVTAGLRQVVLRERPMIGRRRPGGHAVVGYGFFTAGNTPHPALAQLQDRWPALRFALVPRPAD